MNPNLADDTEEDIITPPPLDDTTEEDRDTENRARKRLEADGCPPCYPAEIEYPCREPPEEYRDIMLYWAWEARALLPTPVLWQQSYDWQKFRNIQVINRQRYRRRPFHEYNAVVRQLREKNGVYGEVHLRLDPSQQTQLENWVEFQYVHFWLHSILAKDISDFTKSLEGKPQEELEIFQSTIEFRKRKCHEHETLLRWIEKIRVQMEADLASSLGRGMQHQNHVDDKDASEPVRNSPTPDRRRRGQAKSRPVLGDAGVSKRSYRRRSTRSKPGVTDTSANVYPPLPPPASKQSICSPQPSNVARTTATPRRGKSRQVKEKALRQLHPRKVAKAKATKSLSAKHQHSQYVTEVRTRSGRVSRVPVRWTPSAW